MSQTKTFAATKDTVRRNKDDGTGGQGCGNSKHLYVGRSGAAGSARNYDSFIEFDLDWTDVRKIISAHLNLYTDEYDTFGPAGEPGLMASPAVGDQPRISIYRLTEEFTEGSNSDGNFDSSDWVNPARSSSDAVGHVMAPVGPDLLHSINITAIVRAWAPASVAGGGGKTNHGIGLYGSTSTTANWSGWAMEHTGGGGAAERPSITLVYEQGPTTPDAPSNMSPSGPVPSLAEFEGDFTDQRATDQLNSTGIEIYDAGHSATGEESNNRITDAGHGLKVNDTIYFTSLTGGSGLSTFTAYRVHTVYSSSTFSVKTATGSTEVNITSDYSAMTWSKRVKAFSHIASNSERLAAHFIAPKPTDFIPVTGANYRWRARNSDTEGQVSSWSALVTFSLTNTAPNAPTLSPVSGSSYANFNLVKFEGGTFSDPNNDTLMAHQVQLSPYAQGDVRWDEGDGILWDTGKAYDPFDATSWIEYYGGRALVAGTYYWRARQWDSRDGVSNWTYAQIVLTQDFSPDPGNYDNVQVNFRPPWRILIRNLYQSDGVTKTVGRAPGQLIAVLEEAKNLGASLVFNSPGELHFTLLKDDPQASIIEPKQVHYAVEFYSGDGWQEKFAGVVWDADATETDVVFKGIDYLALYDTVIDERYDPVKPNKSYKSNGSYYPNVSIRTVVLDQLNRAKKLADSWVGFISIGAIATMNEKVTVYSTMQPTLSFVSGLIDSHRQGTGKRTRMSVVKTTTGGYQLKIVDDPGVTRNDLAMYYGELVQGYRVIVFGDGWANVQHVVGRNRDGVKVVYQTIKGKPFQPPTSLYGRIATVSVMDGVQDQSDLARRGLQTAISAAKLGKNVALGLRTEYLSPLQGWDLADVLPIAIDDGVIDTSNFGSGFWAIFACAWEATDVGQQSLVLTVMPREDATAPDGDLIPSRPISEQPEWQLGWTPPDPLEATSKYWLDQTTGIVYVRDDVVTDTVPVTGSP